VSLIALLNTYCYANYKSTVPAFLNDVVTRIITIALVTVYFNRWLSLNQFILCFVLIYGVQLAFVIIYIFYFDKVSFKIDWKYFREQKIFELVRYGMLLWFAGVASIGLKYFDSIMIGKFMPIGNVAIYTIAAFIPTIIEAPLNAIEKIAASKISFAWAENKREEIYSIYHKSSLYMILLGGFLFLNVNINAHSLLSFLPPAYQNGELIILIISIGTLFNMATGLNAPILFNSDKYKYGAYFLILLAIIAFVFQMVFIPLFGLKGAALATSASAFIYNTMLTVCVWKFFRLQPFDKKNIRVALLIILCFALNYIIPAMENIFADVLMRSTIVSAVYLGAIYAMKIVPEFHKFIPLIGGKR
jgi:O-antigen/teichoic acid export membrane protein